MTDRRSGVAVPRLTVAFYWQSHDAPSMHWCCSYHCSPTSIISVIISSHKTQLTHSADKPKLFCTGFRTAYHDACSWSVKMRQREICTVQNKMRILTSHFLFLGLPCFTATTDQPSWVWRVRLFVIGKHQSLFNARVVDRCMCFYKPSPFITCNLVYLFSLFIY